MLHRKEQQEQDQTMDLSMNKGLNHRTRIYGQEIKKIEPKNTAISILN